MELREIATDIYACLQEERGLGTSNSGLINRAGGMVVDTFWDLPHTRAMIDLYATVWKRPATRVVNTHHNGDHCWGNQLFTGAEIIGHRLCAQYMTRENPAMMQGLKSAAGSGDATMAAFAAALAEWDFAGVEITPPTTLIEDRLSLQLDGIRAELIYVGPAHTIGDVIVHLPEHGVVFTGDILFRLCTPIGWEGTFANWGAALDTIVDLKPSVIVPGHGPLCGVEGPREMKAYLDYVYAESRKCYDDGLSLRDASRRIDPGPSASWTEPERIVFNIARAYREFEGGAIDAPVDVPTVFRTMFELRASRPAPARAH